MYGAAHRTLDWYNSDWVSERTHDQISSISSSNSRSKSKGGKSPTSTFSGFTNTPLLFPAHSKYLFPAMLPSFLPVGSSNSMPTQNGSKGWPSPVVTFLSLSGANGISVTGPIYRIVPRRICGGEEGRMIARARSFISVPLEDCFNGYFKEHTFLLNRLNILCYLLMQEVLRRLRVGIESA